MVTEDAMAPLRERAHQQRKSLLAQRAAQCIELPLRLWRQQAHFTTPATGSPLKAVDGLASAARLLARFGLTTADVARASGADQAVLEELLANRPVSPLVMVDAEDAVALDEQRIAAARSGAIAALGDPAMAGCLRFFRPSGLELPHCVDDLLTVITGLAQSGAAGEGGRFPLDGIVWPKVEHPDEVRWLCGLLSECEAANGLPEHTIALQLLIESGPGVSHLAAIAQAALPRLAGLILGTGDYAADVGLPVIENDHPLFDGARCAMVNVAGSVGVPAIDAMTFTYPTPRHRGSDLSSAQQHENREAVLAALRTVYQDALHGLHLGMAGKWVGHPGQLLMVLAAYRSALSKAQVAQDLAELQSYQQAVAQGAGAAIIGGAMADRATDRHVRQRLRRAVAWGLLPVDAALAAGIVSEQEARQVQAPAPEY